MNLNQYRLLLIIFTIICTTLITVENTYAILPIIDSITPDSGLNNLPTDVTITGANFEQGANFSLLPGMPYIKGSVDTPDTAIGVYVSGKYAYVAGGLSGLQIIDISTPASPEIVTSVETDGFVADVYGSGNYAYMVVQYGLVSPAALQVIDISDPFNPSIIGSLDALGEVEALHVSGNYAYIINDWDLEIIDISDPSSPIIIGSVDTPGHLHDVYVSGSYAYVTEGYIWSWWEQEGNLLVIDISIPSNPEIISSINISSYWEADRVYVSGNYAYVTVVGTDYDGVYLSYLHIIDISTPSTPALTGLIHLPEPDWSYYHLYVSGSYAYATLEAGLWVIDISTPSSPIMRGFIGIGGWVHDLYGLGDYVYVTAWDSGLHIIDISSPFSGPATISFVYTNYDPPYGDLAKYVYVSGDYAYVLGADSDADSLYKVDISNPSMPRKDFHVAYIDSGTSLYVSASYAYVTNSEGLHIIDLSGTEIIVSVETPGYAWDVYVSGNYAYVADGSSGLQVIDISNPYSPEIIGSVDTRGFAWDVDVSGNYAYVADWGSGLQVIDISTPSSPEIIGSVELLSDAEAVYISGTYAYVAEGGGVDEWLGLQVIDISTPSSPEIIGSVETPGYGLDVYVSGNYAYVGRSKLLIIDISTPSSPTIITSTTYDLIYGIGENIYFSGDYAYVPKGEGLWVIKTSLITPILLEGNAEDTTTITATIPPDLPESAYNIIVTNPSGEVGILRNGFRVVEAVDITPPVISDVAVLDITDTTAIVTWDTDEPSDSVVKFGTTSGEYTDSISDITLVTSHSQKLTSLTPDTTYYFIVNSADSSGNPTESQEHSFKTLTSTIVDGVVDNFIH
ncbi:MAG: fibronectin type III domain-containing protein [Nitrospinae bacterium]|nr:fibronectin type III domain-containing protein [Nitrospinota bacterium]